MPYLIYDVESAREAGYNDSPVSLLRKLGCSDAEVVAGHEELGVVKIFVKEINFELPFFISIDPEAPQKTITIVYDQPKKQYSY